MPSGLAGRLSSGGAASSPGVVGSSPQAPIMSARSANEAKRQLNHFGLEVMSSPSQKFHPLDMISVLLCQF
jgi:hypothetical protein